MNPFRTLRRLARDARVRIVFFAVLTSFAVGWLGILMPLEDLAKDARYSLKRTQAPQDIVVVEIDDASLNALGSTQVPRPYHVKALDTLFEAGAKRVFFDLIFDHAGDPKEDASLIEAFDRHKSKVFFGAGMADTDTAGGTLSSLPHAKFRDHAETVGIAYVVHPFGMSLSMPYRQDTKLGEIPSISAELAGVKQAQSPSFFQALPKMVLPGHFRPDYSYDYDSIPKVRFIDVVEGRIPADAVAGKDVVIAGTAKIFRDEFAIPFFGLVQGVYLHVMAAYTLERGVPLSIGWLPPLAFVALVLALGIRRRAKAYERHRLAGWFLLTILAPAALESFGVDVEVTPAILAIVIATIRLRSLEKVEQASEINVASGLPSLQRLRASKDKLDGSLIALKIRNYSAITGAFADEIESRLATEVVRRIRISDPGAVVFHEGDKFAWSSSLSNPVDLTDHLEGLHRILQNGIIVDEHDIDLSFNCGVELGVDQPVPNRLARAVQLAEQAFRTDELVCLDQLESQEIQWEISLLSSLDRAIDKGEVWVAYQPKLDLAGNRVKSAEALVRWTHPVRGPVSPEKFIQIAEEHHRIERITRFVLDEAAKTAAGLASLDPDFSVSVNISAQLLRNPDLPEMIFSALRKYELDPAHLILEITETDRLDRSSKTFEMMRQLVDSGLQLSIDDFGTGNATIDYLRFLPAAEVKIDKLFVSNLETNHEDLMLVQSIIEMAHSLGRRVVAEGVENIEVLKILAQLGCDQVQGYHISRPVRGEALEAFVEGEAVKGFG